MTTGDAWRGCTDCVELVDLEAKADRGLRDHPNAGDNPDGITVEERDRLVFLMTDHGDAEPTHRRPDPGTAQDDGGTK